jgi:general secretion pathway protein I
MKRKNQFRAKKYALGMSMIETVAALTILASGAVIIFSWTAQTTGILGRADLTENRQLARLRALDFMRTVNPLLKPVGEQRLGDFLLRWTSQPTGVPQSALSSSGQSDSYELSLHTVKAVLSGKPDLEGLSFELTLAGYRLTRRVDPSSLFQNAAQ